MNVIASSAFYNPMLDPFGDQSLYNMEIDLRDNMPFCANISEGQKETSLQVYLRSSSCSKVSLRWLPKHLLKLNDLLLLIWWQ